MINFEKDPDSKYIALEPQYLSRDKSGQGFRVIAYRKDGYVDVYDDLNLQDDNEGSFNVTGKGLKESKKVAMENLSFNKIDAFPYPFPKDFQWHYYTRYSQDC